MAEKLKNLFKSSFFYRAFSKIRAFPPIALLFDLDFFKEQLKASALFRSLKRAAAIFNFPAFANLFIDERLLCAGLVFCPLFAEFSALGAFFAAVALALLFTPHRKSEDFSLFPLFCMLSLPFLRLFMTLDFFFYIIYVETGAILFCVIKNLSPSAYRFFIRFSAVLWLFSAAVSFSGAARTLIFMPYALMLSKRGKFRKLFFAFFILSIGFSSLIKDSRGAEIGGLFEVLILLILGEHHLLLPLLFAYGGAAAITYEIFRLGAVKTGHFLWRYGLGGAQIALYTPHFFSAAQEPLFYLALAAIFIFFRYVLKTARRAALSLFKNPKQRYLKGALSSTVGFSLFAALSYPLDFRINIILYLMAAALFADG